MHYFWSLQRYPNHISSLYKAFWGPKVLHFKIKLEGRETDKKLGGLKLNFEHHRGTKTIFYPSENPWIKQKQKGGVTETKEIQLDQFTFMRWSWKNIVDSCENVSPSLFRNLRRHGRIIRNIELHEEIV